MKIIKIDATRSTNAFLRQYNLDSAVNNMIGVRAHKQTHGRGQMGTKWNSADYKNLMISYLIPNLKVKPNYVFAISMLSSIAVLETLNDLEIPKLSIKWPNDILSGRKKICGILIETSFKEVYINSTIIGIGININQTEFENLPKASSLKLITGLNYSIDEVCDRLTKKIELIREQLLQLDIETLKTNYYSKLLGYQKVQSFEFPDRSKAAGVITSVSNSGLLTIKFESSKQTFDLKQIKQLY